MGDRHCGECKYFGAPIRDEMHICENDRSIYKAARAIATGCSKFEISDCEDKKQGGTDE